MRGWMKVLGGIAIVAAVSLVVGLVLTYTGGPERDASELVRRAAQAMDEVAVEGTVVTVVRTPDGRRKVRAEMHRGDGRFTMRLLSGRGEGTVVHRQQDAVWIERKGGETVRRANVGDHHLPAELLRRNWGFTSSGTRRAAGQTTTLARGPGRGGSITLAVDQKTGFPLHISRRTRQGELISETTWVNADFSVQPPPKIEPPETRHERRRRSVSLEEARAAVDFNVLEPGWMPKGWELQGWFLNERSRGTMVQARFSDGLRPMMVIQFSAEEVRERIQQWREGREERDGGPRGGPVHPRRGRPDQAERPRGADRPMREGAREHTPRHMRGAGADASRRAIDGTMVIVAGPISEQDRERILESMSASP